MECFRYFFQCRLDCVLGYGISRFGVSRCRFRVLGGGVCKYLVMFPASFEVMYVGVGLWVV